MLGSTVLSAADATKSAGDNFPLEQVLLIGLGVLLSLISQMVVELLRNTWSKGKETREEARAVDREDREEARAVDRESREELRAIARERAAADRERVTAANARQDMACDALDQQLAELQKVIVTAAKSDADKATTQRRSDLLASMIPQAAYLEDPVRERVMIAHRLLQYAHEIAAHQYNRVGEKHYDWIGTYTSNVVDHAREVVAACLRRRAMPPIPDRLIEYLVAFDDNMADREDMYSQEEQEYQEERNTWLAHHPGVEQRRVNEVARYNAYTAERQI